MRTHTEIRRLRFILRAILKTLENLQRENNMLEFNIKLKEYKETKEKYDKLLREKDKKDLDIKLGFKLINNKIVYLDELKNTLETYAELFVTNEEAFIEKDKERVSCIRKMQERISNLEENQKKKPIIIYKNLIKKP